MAEVMAGFVCGFALALVATPAAALALVRARAGRSATIERLMPAGSSLIAVSVIIHGFFFMAATAIGLLLGLMLMGIEDNRPAGGLGSPNGMFTALVLATAAIAVLPLAVVLPRWRTTLVVGGLAFAVCFGWIMPYLSLLGPQGG